MVLTSYPDKAAQTEAIQSKALETIGVMWVVLIAAALAGFLIWAVLNRSCLSEVCVTCIIVRNPDMPCCFQPCSQRARPLGGPRRPTISSRLNWPRPARNARLEMPQRTAPRPAASGRTFPRPCCGGPS